MYYIDIRLETKTRKPQAEGPASRLSINKNSSRKRYLQTNLLGSADIKQLISYKFFPAKSPPSTTYFQVVGRSLYRIFIVAYLMMLSVSKLYDIG
jgi:hypothetical protein